MSAYIQRESVRHGYDSLTHQDSGGYFRTSLPMIGRGHRDIDIACSRTDQARS